MYLNSDLSPPDSYYTYNKQSRHKHIAQIEPNLYLGSSFATVPETLQDFHITHVFYIGFDIGARQPSVEYTKITLDDNIQCRAEMIDLGLQLCTKIKTILERNCELKANDFELNNEPTQEASYFEVPTNRVLVCCSAGRSRSASMIVLYLMGKYPTLTLDEILERITKVRTIGINRGFLTSLHDHYNQTHM